MNSAEIIAVGSELLGSTRLDTNSLFVAQKLAELGVPLRTKTVVGDDRERLLEIFRRALDRADLVVLTGGLGPTDDDVTREVVAAALRLELREDESITARIRHRFERRGMRMPDVNRRQAMVPTGAIALSNSNGTAPGLFLRHEGKTIVLLPGPPRELQPMLDALCTPGGALAELAGGCRIHTASLFTTGRSESHVEEVAQPIYSRWLHEPEPIDTTILAGPGQVELHLTLRSDDAGRARARITAARDQLASALGDCVFSTDGRYLHQLVGDMLRERRLMLAAAESCTGGLLLQRLTEIAGSSDYVAGGVVSYSNEVKVRVLGVDADLLTRHGSVSEPVAAAMADGVHSLTGAGVCVAITGIAGPGGGSEAKPVGTVVIAVRVPDQPLHVRTHLFVGGREMVRLQATQAALDRVRRMLR